MADSTVAQIITACASAFTAVALIITAVAALIRSRRVECKVEEVHKIVNQQQTDLKNYQAALIRALEDRGIPIPVDQSKPDPEKDDR